MLIVFQFIYVDDVILDSRFQYSVVSCFLAACFSKNSVEEILTSFESEASKEGNGWIVPFLGGLKRSSPMSLKISL
ncbi:hypothetical protein ACJIZ3_016834 [Penstemon smallii]|uniref:Enoyl-CoA hydratase/isomerase domain-containing protein n=1 Tax=Penstemon smallii TaxID=265156 RepID=A0ABD3STU2_9LAMI